MLFFLFLRDKDADQDAKEADPMGIVADKGIKAFPSQSSHGVAGDAQQNERNSQQNNLCLYFHLDHPFSAYQQNVL